MQTMTSYILGNILSALIGVSMIIIIPVVLFGGFLLMGHGLNIQSSMITGVGFFGQISMWLGGIWFMTHN